MSRRPSLTRRVTVFLGVKAIVKLQNLRVVQYLGLNPLSNLVAALEICDCLANQIHCNREILVVTPAATNYP